MKRYGSFFFVEYKYLVVVFVFLDFVSLDMNNKIFYYSLIACFVCWGDEREREEKKVKGKVEKKWEDKRVLR